MVVFVPGVCVVVLDPGVCVVGFVPGVCGGSWSVCGCS